MFCISCGISSNHYSSKMCCKLNRNINIQGTIIQNASTPANIVYNKYSIDEPKTSSPIYSPSSPIYSPSSPIYSPNF